MSIGSGEMKNSPKSSELVICDFPTGKHSLLGYGSQVFMYIAEIIH